MHQVLVEVGLGRRHQTDGEKGDAKEGRDQRRRAERVAEGRDDAEENPGADKAAANHLGEIGHRGGCGVALECLSHTQNLHLWTLGGGINTKTDDLFSCGSVCCATVESMRILVVEDESSVAESLRRGLKLEGFEVDVADNGTDGLWMASEGSYDAVLLDIMLPGMNGYKVCRALREAGNWIPIIMLTAKDGELDEAEGLDLGADDYLTKPFSFVVLVSRLRALLRRGAGRGERQDLFEIGDLRLDPVSLRCSRGEESIQLTAREIAVLGFLIRRRDQVVTKQEILDNVWDFDFEGDPNIVEVYIRRIRKKIDEPFGTKTITTVRGAGYRLDGSPPAEPGLSSR